jgi:hypothetical protein
MTRAAAVLLVAAVVAFPLTAFPAAPVTWLAGAALAIGVLGASALSVPLVTTGAAVALVAHALALVLTRAPADPIAGAALGATLVLLLALVHLAARTHGAAVGLGVGAGQVRQWLAVVGAGVLAALGLAAAGAALGPALLGASLPVAIVTGALGVLLAVAGVIALVAAREETP